MNMHYNKTKKHHHQTEVEILSISEHSLSER